MAPSIDEYAGDIPALSNSRLSTVVPATITAAGETHQFTGMDLALKLHYITTVHFFDGDAAADLNITGMKAAMFAWLKLYYAVCGRIRRDDGEGGDGGMFVKCNDSGVRLAEASCEKTVAEWLAAVNGGDHHRLLVHHQPFLATDFGFTPLVLLQLTRFKCGGLCVGMRWTHVLGDAFSATDCINTLWKFMSGEEPPPPPRCFITPTTTVSAPETQSTSSCRSLKLLEPLGNNWIAPNNVKMQMHTFHFTEKQLTDLNKTYSVLSFELISAIVWKALAKMKKTETVTVCKKGKRDQELLGNKGLVVGIVEAQDTSFITDADPLEIAKMIAEKFVNETSMIQKQMQEGDWDFDVLVYGSNLTFVDLEDLNLYQVKLNGRSPVFANLSIGGVWDEGAVVVVPGPGNSGKTVNAILPEGQLEHLKNVLRSEFGIL